MKNYLKQQDGFVLIGLLIVIVIIAILAFGRVFNSKEDNSDNSDNSGENNKRATYENANQIVDEAEKEVEGFIDQKNKEYSEELELIK